MNRPTTDNPPPLACDDPRISEWLDGRLSGGDADDVARAVAASPELARFVEELRAVKAAAAGLETTPPPADFVRSVMAAVAGDRPAAADEAAVDVEWRRLEAERIAEERAEAREDVVEAEPPRRRWTWLAMAASLAAGVLVAVGLNGLVAPPAHREVAQTPAPEQPPAAAPTADSMAVHRPEEQTVGAEAAREELAENRASRDQHEKVAATRGAGGSLAAVAAAVEPPTEEIEIVVEGAAGREELARLLVETGLERKDAEADDEPVDHGGFTAGAVTLEDDRLVVVAEPEVIESFKAALADRGRARVRLHSGPEPPADHLADGVAPKAAAEPSLRAARGKAEDIGGQAAANTPAAPAAGGARPPLRRLVVKIVGDDEPAGAAADAAPAPGALEE